jgi:O-methyltransferase
MRPPLLFRIVYRLSIPIAILFILSSRRIHPAYGMTWLKKLGLGMKMYRNSKRIRTGTSFKSHLAMALKLLELPPGSPGDVVECGTWKGGSAANLSLVCKITGRKLKIFDSFEGLPEAEAGDREAAAYKKGDYCGTLEEVKSNLRRYGAIECCEFIPGWFNKTLPHLDSPVALAFLDVDLEASLETCVRYLWPNLTDTGYIFIDEVLGLDYCALFYSEKYWAKYFNRTPPGLVGAGTGLPLGDYYVGPLSDYMDAAGKHDDYPHHLFHAGAFTRKNLSGYWAFYPGEEG